MRILIFVVVIIVALYILLCAFLYFKQDALLYFPSRNEEVLVYIQNNKLINNFIVKTEEWETIGRSTGSGDCMIFYLGWNAENTDYHFVRERTWWTNCIFATLNYRGYGESTGKANEKNMHEDSIQLFEKIYDYHKPKIVFIVGRSLWTNPAIYLSLMKKDIVNKLVLITPYDSMAHVAKWHYPVFPVKWLINDAFNSSELVKNLLTETLILKASNDTVIPSIHTEKLIESFESKKPTVEHIPQSDHNSISESPVFIEKIEGYLKK
jgi:predicted esterase